MTIEELLKKFVAQDGIGIICGNVEERHEVIEFLAENDVPANGSNQIRVIRANPEVDRDQLILFWDGDSISVAEVTASGDIQYSDIAHLLEKEQVAPVIVDDLI